MRTSFIRSAAAILFAVGFIAHITPVVVGAQNAAPVAVSRRAMAGTATPQDATPAGGRRNMSSIIALATTALSHLSDGRLTAIPEQIVRREEAEITELHLYREKFYGTVKTMPMDEAMMERMAEAMPLRMLQLQRYRETRLAPRGTIREPSRPSVRFCWLSYSVVGMNSRNRRVALSVPSFRTPSMVSGSV